MISEHENVRKRTKMHEDVRKKTLNLNVPIWFLWEALKRSLVGEPFMSSLSGVALCDFSGTLDTMSSSRLFASMSTTLMKTLLFPSPWINKTVFSSRDQIVKHY